MTAGGVCVLYPVVYGGDHGELVVAAATEVVVVVVVYGGHFPMVKRSRGD